MAGPKSSAFHLEMHSRYWPTWVKTVRGPYSSCVTTASRQSHLHLGKLSHCPKRKSQRRSGESAAMFPRGRRVPTGKECSASPAHKLKWLSPGWTTAGAGQEIGRASCRERV